MMNHSRLLATFSITVLSSACTFGAHDQNAFVTPPKGQPHAIVDVKLANAPLTELAQSALAKGETSAAISLAQRTLDGAPGDRIASQILAEALLADGQAEASVSAFKSLLSLDGNDAAARAGLGMALLASGDPATAKAELEKAMVAKPDATVIANIGLALALAGDTAGAIKVLEPVALSGSGNIRSRQNLALALTLSGNRAKAYTVAALDMGAVPAVRQVDAWYADADKPLPDQLKQFAGLSVKSSGPVQTAALGSASTAPVKIAEVLIPANSYDNSVASLVKPVVLQDDAEALPKPVSIMPVIRAPILKQVTIIKTAKLGAEPGHPAPEPAKVELASLRTQVSKPFVQIKGKLPGFTSMTKYTTQHITSGWFIQLAAVTVDVSSASMTTRIKQQFSHFLAKIGILSTYDAQIGDKRIKRVVLGPYTNKATASHICGGIKAKGKACFVRAVSPAKTTIKI